MTSRFFIGSSSGGLRWTVRSELDLTAIWKMYRKTYEECDRVFSELQGSAKFAVYLRSHVVNKAQLSHLALN